MSVKFDGNYFVQNKVLHPNSNNVVNIYIVYKLNPIRFSKNTDFTIQNALFGAMKITKNGDTSKNKYERYGICFDIKINKYEVKCGTSLRFWENKGWISPIDPYGWFQWYCRYYLGRRCSDDERQIKRWKSIVSRFKSILVKIIKNKGAKFNDYPISPKIRQILLHWGYEFVENDLF